MRLYLCYLNFSFLALSFGFLLWKMRIQLFFITTHMSHLPSFQNSYSIILLFSIQWLNDFYPENTIPELQWLAFFPLLSTFPLWSELSFFFSLPNVLFYVTKSAPILQLNKISLKAVFTIPILLMSSSWGENSSNLLNWVGCLPDLLYSICLGFVHSYLGDPFGVLFLMDLLFPGSSSFLG